MMSEGVVLVSFPNSLKGKWGSIQNEINLENTNDIITTISNNYKETVTVKENEIFCLVCYKKYDYKYKK